MAKKYKPRPKSKRELDEEKRREEEERKAKECHCAFETLLDLNSITFDKKYIHYCRKHEKLIILDKRYHGT